MPRTSSYDLYEKNGPKGAYKEKLCQKQHDFLPMFPAQIKSIQGNRGEDTEKEKGQTLVWPLVIGAVGFEAESRSSVTTASTWLDDSSIFLLRRLPLSGHHLPLAIPVVPGFHQQRRKFVAAYPDVLRLHPLSGIVKET